MFRTFTQRSFSTHRVLLKEAPTLVSDLHNRLSQCKIITETISKRVQLDKVDARLKEISNLTEQPTFWQNSKEAQKIMREQTNLKDMYDFVTNTRVAISNNEDLLTMSIETNENELIGEINNKIQKLHAQLEERQLYMLMNRPNDECDCIIEIHPGAGGTESADWAEMLMEMYHKWAIDQDFSVTIESSKKEVGIKQATVIVSGKYAYGWLRRERGTHRLVRLSPFDAANKRHTSFASVDVIPIIDDSIKVEILQKDLRIDTYRSQSAGGQHVNKTDSAVRITHIPTNISVQCQSQRSQHQNKATALKILESRLYEMENKKRNEQKLQDKSSLDEATFGNQIRSYVLQPYKMVKDLRTGHETNQPEQVLQGGPELTRILKSLLMYLYICPTFGSTLVLC